MQPKLLMLTKPCHDSGKFIRTEQVRDLVDEGDIDVQELTGSSTWELAVEAGIIGALHGTGLSLKANAAGTIDPSVVADIWSRYGAVDERGRLQHLDQCGVIGVSHCLHGHSLLGSLLLCFSVIHLAFECCILTLDCNDRMSGPRDLWLHRRWQQLNRGLGTVERGFIEAIIGLIEVKFSDYFALLVYNEEIFVVLGQAKQISLLTRQGCLTILLFSGE